VRRFAVRQTGSLQATDPPPWPCIRSGTCRRRWRPGRGGGCGCRLCIGCSHLGIRHRVRSARLRPDIRDPLARGDCISRERM